MGHTTWREEVAIPSLENVGISYFNPQLPIGQWTLEYEQVEIEAKEQCDVMLWVITAETRGVTSVAEAVFYIAEGRPLALALEMLKEKAVINGKMISEEERDDLNRGRIFLRTIAREYSVPIFANETEAVEYAIDLCQSRSSQLTIAEIIEALKRIECRNYEFVVTPTLTGCFLQVESIVEDVQSGDLTRQRGRKWFIEKEATVDDIIRTGFKAVVTWEEHELRESFYFDGERVFGPHFDIELVAHQLRSRNKL